MAGTIKNYYGRFVVHLIFPRTQIINKVKATTATIKSSPGQKREKVDENWRYSVRRRL